MFWCDMLNLRVTVEVRGFVTWTNECHYIFLCLVTYLLIQQT